MASIASSSTSPPPCFFLVIDQREYERPRVFHRGKDANIRRREMYVAVSCDLYLLERKANESPPTAFSDFRGSKRLDIERGSSHVVRAADGNPRTLSLTYGEKLYTRVFMCRSESEMEALASLIEQAGTSLSIVGEKVLAERKRLSSADVQVLGEVVAKFGTSSFAIDSQLLSTTDGVATERIASLSETVRGAFDTYQKVTEWFGAMAGIVAGSRDAVGVLQKMFDTIPIASPIVQVIGLAGDIALLEHKRKERKHEMKAVSRQCQRITTDSIRAILFSMNYLAVSDSLVQRLFDVLENCCRVSRSAERFVMMSVRSQFWTDEVDGLCDEVKALKTETTQLEILQLVQSIHHSLQPSGNLNLIEPNLPQGDTFEAAWYIPVRRIVAAIDFEIASGTPESQLLQITKRETNTSGGLVSVRGMSGVGKSTILNCLVHEQSVQTYFDGGIYCLQIGSSLFDGSKEDAERTVISELAKAAKKSGGTNVSSEISKSNLVDAVEKAREWFSGRRCLFVFDDLLRIASSPSGFLHDLRPIVDADAGSRVVFSSRDHHLVSEVSSNDSVEVKPRPKHGSEAKRILLAHTGFPKENVDEALSKGADDEYVKSFMRVLCGCNGLPLSLGVVGRAAARMGDISRPLAGFRELDSHAEVDNLQLEAVDERGMEGYSGFEANICTTWTALERYGTTVAEYNISEIRKMHTALFVFERQARVPMSVLQRLWKVDSTAKACQIARAMDSLNIADIHTDGDVPRELSLHDLLHTLCCKLAKHEVQMSPESWHNQLLSSYIPTDEADESWWGIVPGVIMKGGSKSRGWWECEDLHDSYMRRNLSRHLVESGRTAELESLLLDFRWLKRRVAVGSEEGRGPVELLSIERDYKTLVLSMKRSEDREVFPDIAIGEAPWDAFTVFAEAVRLSWSRVTENPSELGFQMHGRLLHLRRIQRVSRFLESLGRHSEYPALRSIRPSLALAGGPVRQIIPLGSFVESLAIVPGSRTVLLVMRGRVHLLHLDNRCVERVLSPGEDDVSCVAVSGDGLFAVGGCRSGRVHVWSLQSGCDKSLSSFWAGRIDINSIAVTAAGKRVVTGSSDGKVRIMEVQSGAMVFVGSGHIAAATSVSVDRFGRSIASGGTDGMLRIWQISESGSKLLSPQAIVDFGRGPVVCVAWAPNGQLVVARCLHGEIFVCTVFGQITGDAIGIESDVSTLRPTENVIVSRDGQRIIAGAVDGSVHLFDIHSHAYARSPIPAHQSIVWCVEESMSGGHVVSAAADGTICEWSLAQNLFDPAEDMKHNGSIHCLTVSTDSRLVATGGNDGLWKTWDASMGTVRQTSCTGHSREILCLAFSPNGKLLASGSEDCTVRIWNVDTGEDLHGPLASHTGLVNCVAFSPDGGLVASCSRDDTVRLWNVLAGQEVGEPTRWFSFADRVMFSNDAKLVRAVNDFRKMRTWDVETRNRVRNADFRLFAHPASNNSFMQPGDLDVSNYVEIRFSQCYDDVSDLVSEATESDVDIAEISSEDSDSTESDRRSNESFENSCDEGRDSARDPIPRSSDENESLAGSAESDAASLSSDRGNKWRTAVSDTEDSEGLVQPLLGRFDCRARNWLYNETVWFDRRRKRLWAGLADGTVAVVELVDAEPDGSWKQKVVQAASALVARAAYMFRTVSSLAEHMMQRWW